MIFYLPPQYFRMENNLTIKKLSPPEHFNAQGGIMNLVNPAGLEPATVCLEGRCSIQLSYESKPIW